MKDSTFSSDRGRLSNGDDSDGNKNCKVQKFLMSRLAKQQLCTCLTLFSHVNFSAALAQLRREIS